MNSSLRTSDSRNKKDNEVHPTYTLYKDNLYFRQGYDTTSWGTNMSGKKLAKVGYFPQINILKTYNKIYINDFNMEFKDLLGGICKSLGMDINNIVFNELDDPPDAVVEVYANNLEKLSDDAITAKLSLLTTYESTEEYK